MISAFCCDQVKSAYIQMMAKQPKVVREEVQNCIVKFMFKNCKVHTQNWLAFQSSISNQWG